MGSMSFLKSAAEAEAVVRSRRQRGFMGACR
jgi:hypothetical protein